MTYSRDKAKFKVSAEKWTVVIIKGAFKPLSAGVSSMIVQLIPSQYTVTSCHMINSKGSKRTTPAECIYLETALIMTAGTIPQTRKRTST